VNSSFAELGHKLEVLERHCQDVGRDRGAIGVSCLGTLVVAADDAAARAKAAQLLTTRGADASILDDAETFRRVLPRMIVGGPEEVVEQVRALRSVGLDGVVFNLPDVHDLETVALAGQVLAEAS
jgi:alkanesulfonate monooxygenase SsuD/methylene tetrahydromethanopterin reductase-like flavin-dependent oxidoreductase (luciferase family)